MDSVSETVRIADNQLKPYNNVWNPSPSQAGGKATDTYVEATNAGCSVSAVNSGSTFGFWSLILMLFGSD